MTSREPAYFGVRPQAGNAWRALTDALNQLTDQGRQPVCATRPDQWASNASPAARRDAIEACTYCPVLAACRAFAEANDERQGVFGGRDFTPQPQRRPPHDTPLRRPRVMRANQSEVVRCADVHNGMSGRNLRRLCSNLTPRMWREVPDLITIGDGQHSVVFDLVASARDVPFLAVAEGDLEGLSCHSKTIAQANDGGKGLRQVAIAGRTKTEASDPERADFFRTPPRASATTTRRRPSERG